MFNAYAGFVCACSLRLLEILFSMPAGFSVARPLAKQYVHDPLYLLNVSELTEIL
jgi:hypothetical protein